MNRIIITSAVVSKGYQDQPALRFYDKSDSARRSVRFKVGERVYDKWANNNTHYVNHSVKAFGGLAERIEKMGLKEGSYVNLIGQSDVDAWDDNGTTKRTPIIILDDIEFCYSGSGNGKNQEGSTSVSSAAPENEDSGSFGGYESFGGSNSLY